MQLSLRPDGRVKAASQASQFRIDLAPMLTDPNVPLGLQFDPIAPNDRKQNFGNKSRAGKVVNFNVSYTLARLLFTSQILIVGVLMILVGGLTYTAYRINQSANYYYATAAPYLEEAKMHGMSIMRNADDSSRSLHSTMDDIGALSATSIPTMADTLNRTSQAMSRLTNLVSHPTLKVSME